MPPRSGMSRLVVSGMMRKNPEKTIYTIATDNATFDNLFKIFKGVLIQNINDLFYTNSTCRLCMRSYYYPDFGSALELLDTKSFSSGTALQQKQQVNCLKHSRGK